MAKYVFRRGDSIPVHVEYEYKGIPQNGKFKFEVAKYDLTPWNSIKTWPEVDVTDIPGAMDWEPLEFDTAFVIPSNMPLGSYATRGTLRTLIDVTKEDEIDWELGSLGVLEIIA